MKIEALRNELSPEEIKQLQVRILLSPKFFPLSLSLSIPFFSSIKQYIWDVRDVRKSYFFKNRVILRKIQKLHVVVITQIRKTKKKIERVKKKQKSLEKAEKPPHFSQAKRKTLRPTIRIPTAQPHLKKKRSPLQTPHHPQNRDRKKRKKKSTLLRQKRNKPNNHFSKSLWQAEILSLVLLLLLLIMNHTLILYFSVAQVINIYNLTNTLQKDEEKVFELVNEFD